MVPLQSLLARHWTQPPLAPEHLGVMLPVQFWQGEPQCVGWLRSTHVDPPHSAVPLGQLLAHSGVPSVRQPYMQDIIVEAVHEPLPLQSAGVVAMPLVQVAAAPQEVVFDGNTQANL